MTIIDMMKKMKIGIIHGFDGGYFHTEYSKKILEEIERLGNEGVDISTNNLDLVGKVSAAYMMPHALKLDFKELSKGTRVINSYDSQNIAMNKIKTSNRLIEDKIPTP